MLSASRYLLGVAEIGLLAAFASLGAARLRSRLLPSFSGAPAHLATAVLALALLIWTAELLGSFSLFQPASYLLAVAIVGTGIAVAARGGSGSSSSPVGGAGVRGRAGPPEGPGGGGTSCTFSAIPPRSADHAPPKKLSEAPTRSLPSPTGPAGRRSGPSWATLTALLIAAAAVVHFAAGVRLRLGTGMTGFDSTWYHGPFAAGFFQTGNTFDLHFIAPQFLAWFYPANAEIFHAVGMLAFHRDLISPLLNVGWLLGCLLALWCIGRPFGVAPWSLALGAMALSVSALADQAGEARNDIAGTFFLLASIAIALSTRPPVPQSLPSRVGVLSRMPGQNANSLAALAVAGLAAGLAAGTKLDFLPPAAVLVVGLALLAPRGARLRALAATGLPALAGGGYWYLRNLLHTGNPLPWFGHLGPISLPTPGQALGGREGHAVLGYLSDGSVWADWFLPGLDHGLGLLWPLIAGAALLGLALAVGRGASAVLRVAGAAGVAAVFAWLVAPTSASGPAGMPRGFESGLRYLAPALVLGLALLPLAPALSSHLARLAAWRPHPRQPGERSHDRAGRAGAQRPALALGVVLLALLAVAIGYPIQRHYLESRYERPSFTTPGLDAAFKWARSVSDARIATTSTRQYPLFGTDLSNQVQFVGAERPHGGFVAPTSCRAWRRALDAGNYDYVVTSRDRIEPGKPPYPPTAHWTESPGAKAILRKPPTIVFKLTAPLNPEACR